MKRIIPLLFMLVSINIFAQTGILTKEDLGNELQPLKTSIQALQSDNSKLKTEVGNLKTKLSDANKTIESLQKLTQSNSSAISQTANELGVKISTTETNANQKITEIDNSLSTKTFYGIIGVLIAILISGFLYWLLSKRQQTDKGYFEGKLENNATSLKTDIISEIEKTKKELQQENIKLDLKLMEVMDSQLNASKPTEIIVNSNEPATIDHSLPLKVADEITRINAYANTLDPNSQDSKALKSSVKRLLNTFKASQYEIIDLLGQKYDDGMKVIVVNAVEDSNLKQGEEIISRIIKPLVKYNGEQIQAAQVDISIGI
jgi:cell division septum initiation protein DivIVA